MLIRGSIENMMDRCDYDPVTRNGKELIDPSDDDRGDFIAASFSFSSFGNLLQFFIFLIIVEAKFGILSA